MNRGVRFSGQVSATVERPSLASDATWAEDPAIVAALEAGREFDGERFRLAA